MQYCIFSRRGRRGRRGRRVLTMQMEGGGAETRSGWNIRAKQSMSLRNLF